MVQIIKGTFGYFNGRKVVPITEADGPKTFDPELEARLVKKGVAKYISENEHAQNETMKTLEYIERAQTENTEAEVLTEMPEYNENMKLAELKEIAAAYGVDASAIRSKTAVIEAIETSKQENDVDGEEPPCLDVEDPV